MPQILITYFVDDVLHIESIINKRRSKTHFARVFGVLKCFAFYDFGEINDSPVSLSKHTAQGGSFEVRSTRRLTAPKVLKEALALL